MTKLENKPDNDQSACLVPADSATGSKVTQESTPHPQIVVNPAQNTRSPHNSAAGKPHRNLTSSFHADSKKQPHRSPKMSDKQKPRTPQPIVDDHLKEFDVGSGLIVRNPFAPGKETVSHSPSMRLPPNLTLGEYMTRGNSMSLPKTAKPFKPLDDPSAFMTEEEFERERDRQDYGRQYIHKYKDHARKYHGWVSDEVVNDDPKYQEALSLYNAEYDATRVIRSVEREAELQNMWHQKHNQEASHTTRSESGDCAQQNKLSEGDGNLNSKQINPPIHENQQSQAAAGGYSSTNVPNQTQNDQQWPMHNLSHATHSGYNPHYQTGFPSHEFFVQNNTSNEFQGPHFGSLAVSKIPPAPTEPQINQSDVKSVPGHGDVSLFKFPPAKGDNRSPYNDAHPPECKCNDCEPWRLTPNDVSQMPPTIRRNDGDKREAGKGHNVTQRSAPRQYTGSSHFKRFQADFAVAFDRYIQKHGHTRRTSIEIFDEIAKDPIFKNYPDETPDSLRHAGTPYRLPVGYGRYKYQERGRLFGLFDDSENVPSNSQGASISNEPHSQRYPQLGRQILPGRDNNQLLNAVEQYKYEMEPARTGSNEEKPSLDAFGRSVPSIDESLADFAIYRARKKKWLEEMENKKKTGETLEATAPRSFFGSKLESTVFPGLVSPNFEGNLISEKKPTSLTQTPSRPPGLASPVRSNIDTVPHVSYPPFENHNQIFQGSYQPSVNLDQAVIGQNMFQGDYQYGNMVRPLQTIQQPYMQPNSWANVTVTQGYPTFQNFADYNAHNTQAHSLFTLPPVDYSSLMEHSRQLINPQQQQQQGQLMHGFRGNDNNSAANRGRRRQRPENRARSQQMPRDLSSSHQGSSTQFHNTARESENDGKQSDR